MLAGFGGAVGSNPSTSLFLALRLETFFDILGKQFVLFSSTRKEEESKTVLVAKPDKTCGDNNTTFKAKKGAWRMPWR